MNRINKTNKMSPEKESPEPSELHKLILSLDKPHILKNFKLKWPIFDKSFEEFLEIIENDEPVTFEIGTKKHSNSPYWERFRRSESMKFTEFLQNVKNDRFVDEWATYSYKDIQLWPEELKNTIDFSELGFEHTKDVLFWLGTEGANTPCHYDTYGFNIVVQIFGRKSWLLFPPDTPLDVTRVPFEESSVYCKQNFYSPSNMIQLQDISDKGYEVILEPGDILIVPTKWWHYVENLDTCLTVNTWIPLTSDDDLARLEECFVRIQIQKLTENLEESIKEAIFNPNESSDLQLNLLEILEPLAKIVVENQNEHTNQAKLDFTQTLRKYCDILKAVQPISSKRFFEIMTKNSERFSEKISDHNSTMEALNLENIINATCHPNVISKVCNNYLKLLSEK